MQLMVITKNLQIDYILYEDLDFCGVCVCGWRQGRGGKMGLSSDNLPCISCCTIAQAQIVCQAL